MASQRVRHRGSVPRDGLRLDHRIGRSAANAHADAARVLARAARTRAAVGHDRLCRRSLPDGAGLVEAATVKLLQRGSAAVMLGIGVGVRLLGAQATQDTTRCGQDTLARKNVPLYAQALVVGLQSYFGNATTPVLGAGIIVGSDSRGLLIVTAGHVVRKRSDGTPARTIWVCFASQGSRRTATLASLDSAMQKGLDLAVLRIAGDPRSLNQWLPQSWDRQGVMRSVGRDDPVNPVGCLK